ncbi:MAG TPA: hypothetical protein DIV40_06360 [Clostridiales bacterium]|nr:hypothetical protein [Clostridiales bacterium]
MNYRVYYNRCNHDKTKFTDIVVIGKSDLHKLSKMPWITVCKIAPVNEPKCIFFSVYPLDTFNNCSINQIKPISIKGWN